MCIRDSPRLGWRVEIERVLEVERRMVSRKVEREEIVPLALHFRAHGDDKAELAEDGADVRNGAGYRMLAAGPPVPGRHGEVQLPRLALALRGCQRLTARLERGLEGGLG